MIAIIPARSGSKGLRNKNILDFNGKPLIAYSILEALKSKKVSRVFVSTDDLKIAEIAMKFGAEVPFIRPKNLARDNSLAIDNYIYTLNKLESLFNIDINDFIVLQPTSPLRTFDDIDNAISIFEKKNADSVISYTQEYHPITWHKYLSDDNHFIEIFDHQSLSNRQSNRVTYFPNGALYVFKKKLIFEKRYYSDNSFAYIMPRNKSVDIDNIDDFEYAEFLMKKL